ncbi:MAG TPA: ABC transporter permease [Polyangiales bacterium]|nr:ABC transporter permease [Polyangiales bacterium]
MPDAAPTASDPEESSKRRTSLRDAGEWLVKLLLAPFVELGGLFELFGEALFWGIRPPYRGRLLVEAMEFVGIGSIFIVSLTALFVGGVLALQLVDGFRDFGAENQSGAVIGLALAREVGPVFAALMVTSRAGSAMTTELGSMRVTSQIDALITMAINPVQFLVVPRLVAGLVMVPVLTMLFNVVGVFGAFFVAVSLLGLDPGVFMDRLRWLVDWEDVSQGLIKAMVFGIAVTLIACRQGFYAKGGAAGVGRATNRAVVQSAIAILMLDYLVTSLILGQGFF